MIGQVATTRVVAQMTAGRNGRNIQKQAPISPPTKRTARVVRVRSEWPSMPNGGLGVRFARLYLSAHHQLQTVPVWVAKINAAVLTRAAAHRAAVALQIGFQCFVRPARHVQGEMVYVVARRQRNVTLLLEKSHPQLPSMQEHL